MKLRVVLRVLLVLSLLQTLGASPSDAEVVPDGTHLTHEDAVVHLGPWRDYTTWTYDIRRGDTLSEIAQAQLGTVKRLGQLREMNPGLDERRLHPGQALVMPPRKQPAAHGVSPARSGDAPRPWWDFFVLPLLDDGESRPARVDGGRKVPWHREGVTLFAIRHDHVDQVLQAIAAAPGHGADVLERFSIEGVAATSQAVLGGRRIVDETSDVHYGVTGYEVRGIAGGRIELTRRARRELDQNRELLGGTSGGGRLPLVLVVLGLGGLIALGVFLRRRASTFEMPVSPG